MTSGQFNLSDSRLVASGRSVVIVARGGRRDPRKGVLNNRTILLYMDKFRYEYGAPTTVVPVFNNDEFLEIPAAYELIAAKMRRKPRR